MKKIKIIALLLPVSIFLTGFCYSQNASLQKAEFFLKLKNQDSTIFYLDSIKTEDLSAFESAKFQEVRGILEIQRDNHGLAFEALKKAKNEYTLIDSLKQAAKINLHIIDLLAHQRNIKVSSQPYIDEYLAFSENSNDLIDKANAYSTLAVTYLKADEALESEIYFDKAIKAALLGQDTLLATDFLFNKGVVYNTISKKYDEALKIFKQVIPVYKKNNDLTFIAYSYNNQAEAYKKKHDYLRAIKYYQKADSINLNKNDLKSKAIFYQNLTDVYEKTKDYQRALTYSKKLNTIKDSIDNLEQNIAINDIQERYDNQTLRADNLESETKRLESEANARKKQNLVYGLGGALALGSIIAFLLFKNTKRKQKLAEQDKELETQKLTTVLKEQELKSIDAMIEGQEKERQRIANDLHDDLGGLMATVKLHFNALKDKQTPELYDKTNQLIDEAYDKVRTVAHAKNSGVIAKQGLLKAINDMAENISASNKIKIDVIDHGLETRLENSLELTIFRIIQELITNVIKHARASEATIHITNHEDSLNIMVEDNGIGFNPSQVTKTNKGMGISSIDKRIEHLEGSMTIESEKKQGTTIIIDIPL
ncbi:sensor histidine kinase [uncultured Psychroserpens sp.]|uniref:tetratricopeptide repeat-containing sensor histidine kinase n=1 Tax=uncultured Psychroserpens sp. TaxID=255436 RepID=UPI00262B348E|nr:sensor histidine kinase [uncultured Psychroserpens sp.]